MMKDSLIKMRKMLKIKSNKNRWSNNNKRIKWLSNHVLLPWWRLNNKKISRSTEMINMRRLKYHQISQNKIKWNNVWKGKRKSENSTLSEDSNLTLFKTTEHRKDSWVMNLMKNSRENSNKKSITKKTLLFVFLTLRRISSPWNRWLETLWERTNLMRTLNKFKW